MLVLDGILESMCKVDEEAAISMVTFTFDLEPLRVQQYTPCSLRKISSASLHVYSLQHHKSGVQKIPSDAASSFAIIRHDRLEISFAIVHLKKRSESNKKKGDN